MKDLQIDFTLAFDGLQWVCKHEGWEVTAGKLDELDDKLVSRIGEQFGTGRYHIDMHFDMRDIPRWLHQYMPHYFNRKLVIEIQ